ncbi:MAG: hypothetical protein VKJ24_14965 [Synechococcales bacterium]|nr:hypothetical protein [Synechococcales bacterium]
MQGWWGIPTSIHAVWLQGSQIATWGWNFWQRVVLVTIASSILPLPGDKTAAQLVPCQPPAIGEYLLMVRSQTASEQAQVRSKVPSDATVMVCDYQAEVVTRIGGFGTEEVAKAWAQYLLQSTGFPAIVARPGAIAPTPKPAPTPAPMPTPIATPPTVIAPHSSYNPKPLGQGYAVIVNYNHQPEIAGKLKQALNKEIGVVAYGQRPYLLVTHTSDQAAANSIMQLLSDRGFLAMVVDSRQLMLLKSTAVIR